jgi:hypothetical protein
MVVNKLQEDWWLTRFLETVNNTIKVGGEGEDSIPSSNSEYSDDSDDSDDSEYIEDSDDNNKIPAQGDSYSSIQFNSKNFYNLNLVPCINNNCNLQTRLDNIVSSTNNDTNIQFEL